MPMPKHESDFHAAGVRRKRCKMLDTLTTYDGLDRLTRRLTQATNDRFKPTSSTRENSSQLARRSLLICAVLALFGSLASIPEIAHGQMHGAPKYLLVSSVVVELGIIFTFLIFPRIRPEPLAVAASIYFSVYLSAGCLACLSNKQQAGYFILFFLWFSPLLVFNRLVNRPAIAGILGKLILVVPLCIVMASWVQLKHMLPGKSLFCW